MFPAAALAVALAATPSVQLAAAAQLYRDYDLPLPPAKAKLYRFTVHYIEQPGEDPFPPSYQFGFALAADKTGKPTNVLIGMDENDWVPGFASTVEEIGRGTGWPRPLQKDAAELPFALQCELLGWHDLALAAFEQWRSKTLIDPNIRQELQGVAWEYWSAQFRHHNADRAKVARRLNAMVAHLDPPTNDPFLHFLNLSLKPSGAKTGSAEAAIDELMDARWHHGASFKDGLDPRVEDVVRLGFDAVPALIAHLDDDRLTRTHHNGYYANFGRVES